jgi:hypothetical protein
VGFSRNKVGAGLAVALVAFAGLTFMSGQFVPAPNAGGGAGGASIPQNGGNPAWVSGRYYHPSNASGLATAIGVVNTLRCNPITIPNALTLTRLAAEITTTGEAGSKLRLGIYADDGTGRPGALVVDAGQIDGTVVGSLQELTISTAFASPGRYFGCVVAQSCPTTCPTYRTITGVDVPIDAGTTLPASNTQSLVITQASVSGGLPNPFTGTTIAVTATAFLTVKVL